MMGSAQGAVVLSRWAVECQACGSRITGIETEADAEWFAEEHNRDCHGGA